MKGLLKLTGIIMLGLALLFGGISIWNRSVCKIYGWQTERETKYATFVGCMVELNGKWYPRNELRIAQ